ncbi:hypothetical protein [Salinigranum rubrum]|uniref:hypothetical protein n=1 Tax=Salinigranum rubrum TaxID=755307 RepID=UPI001C1FE38C|nr:hypothetical protein [Salinigranum rubrum]
MTGRDTGFRTTERGHGDTETRRHGDTTADDAEFDDRGTFVTDYLPDPGPFLEQGRVLDGEDHTVVHGWSRDVFEARGVYDATFGYNLARLNLDARHPDAGIRYAFGDGGLRAEFTPTTAFCPQAETLAVAAVRAWNDRGDGVEPPAPPATPDALDDAERVSVRVAPLHRDHDSINDRLRALEADR